MWKPLDPFEFPSGVKLFDRAGREHGILVPSEYNDGHLQYTYWTCSKTLQVGETYTFRGSISNKETVRFGLRIQDQELVNENCTDPTCANKFFATFEQKPITNGQIQQSFTIPEEWRGKLGYLLFSSPIEDHQLTVAGLADVDSFGVVGVAFE